MTLAGSLVALITIALIVGVLALARVAMRSGSSWLRPAHTPLWLVAGLVVGVSALIVQVVVPDLVLVLSQRLNIAARGPSARMAQVALALAVLLVVFALTRIVFAALRRRRLDRGPVPAWFLLAGIAPDGAPLRHLRARVFAGALIAASTVAVASVLLPFEADSFTWASVVAVLTAGMLAYAPTPRPEVVSLVVPHEAHTPDAIVHPLAQHLAEARELMLAGREVLWIGPTPDVVQAAFASAPEAVILPPLRAVTLDALAELGPTRLDHIVVEDTQRMTGVELTWLAQLLAHHPRAEVVRPLGATTRARPLKVTALVPVLPRPLASTGTPIRTTRVRLVGIQQRARHRFRGPLELELVAARAELYVTADGERQHGPDQRRAHTRSGDATQHTIVVDARVAVVPSADVVTLHTLAHVLRELAPTLFRGASDLLGVTYATATELAGPHGGLVVHDRDPHGPGSVADVNEHDWLTWLGAARERLMACDCAAHCARCCESVTCTSTPHNVGLDRRRTLALLDGLLVPSAIRAVA